MWFLDCYRLLCNVFFRLFDRMNSDLRSNLRGTFICFLFCILLGEGGCSPDAFRFSSLFSCRNISIGLIFSDGTRPTCGQWFPSIDEDRFLEEVGTTVMFVHPYATEEDIERRLLVVENVKPG